MSFAWETGFIWERSSSLSIRAVLRSGFSDLLESIKVLTFQHDKVKKVDFYLDRKDGKLANSVCWPSMSRTGYFWSTFSSSVLNQEGKQSYPKEGCLVAQEAAELPCCSRFKEERPSGLSRLCAGLQLQLPVFPHLLLHRSSNASINFQWSYCHDLRWNEI